MKFLIIEDEPLIAQRLKRLTQELLPKEYIEFVLIHELDEAIQYVSAHSVDLCFLDLNLSGKEGFDLLRHCKQVFPTIVTSAYTDKAIDAFQYEVLDFVPKPFVKDRLNQALQRFKNLQSDQSRSLLVQSSAKQKVIAYEHISFIKGAGNYTQVECLDGIQYLHSSPIGELSTKLQSHFQRVHKSYLVSYHQIDSLINHGAGKYEIILKSGKSVPVSRTIYADLQNQLNGN